MAGRPNPRNGTGVWYACVGCKKEFQARDKGVRTKYCTRECYLHNFVVWNKNKKHVSIIGERHFNWKGGVSGENKKIRDSFEYRMWRKAVFDRDDYTCQVCGKRGCVLNADHILPFSMYPDERLNVDNGRTLCVPCHKVFGWKSTKNQHTGKNEEVFGVEVT